MGRLRKRLERYQVSQPRAPHPDDVPYQEEQPQYNPLIEEYDRLQQKAEEYQKELKTIEAGNPHTLYKDIVTKPSSKGRTPLTIMGRPLDLAKLENYLVYKISPRTITTLIRYGDARAIEEIKGYSKRRPIRFKGGIIWIILGAVVILILGYVLTTQDISGFFQGMFGGL